MSDTLFAHLSANGTTTVKDSDGIVDRVLVNTTGDAGNTLTIRDGSIVIAVIDTTVTRPTMELGIPCDTSIVAVLDGGTAADVTVVYR